MTLKQLIIPLLCASSLLFGETKEITLTDSYSKGEILVDDFDRLDITFSNGAHLKFSRTNRNDVVGPTKGIYAISFIDSVGTYSYDLNAPALSPDYKNYKSSNSFTETFNHEWNTATLPEIHGVDTIVHTTAVFESDTTIDGIYPGHLLFTHFRSIGSYFSEVSIYEGINDWIYCRVEGKPSIRFRFMGMQYGELVMGVNFSSIIQWESDAMGDGIFKGDVADIAPITTKSVKRNTINISGNNLILNVPVKSGAELTLLDSRGRICFKTNTSANQVSLPPLASGIYYWSLKSVNTYLNGKVLLSQ